MAKKKTITWTNERRKLADLIPWEHNPRTINNAQAERLVDSVETFGQVETLAVGPGNELYNGHQRLSVLAGQYGMDHEVDVRVASRSLTKRERQQLTVYLHKGAAGEWSFEELANWGINDDLLTWGFAPEELGIGLDDEPATAGTDTEPQVDKAEELRAKWNVELGQLWALGEHRLICGDCTDPVTVGRLMGGEKAALCHADPPYGMGKEKDGIANDNLYREKLDAFQMAWWRAARPHVEDNGSAYIWGNSEDLWRLWYCGGLRDSERLTMRNEVVWWKGDPGSGRIVGMGQATEGGRAYAELSERAMFFMLGEQGFNNNADNYWDGWEPIRAYLKEQRDLMGWDNAKCKELAGHSPKSGCHWFDASQWMFVTGDVYQAWQAAAQGQAFQRDYDELKRDYDELKRDFYATRAYFDNTHDNMTDVWSFPRITGDDRHGHATPKPVAMVERAIKSSCPDGGVVYVPFGGTAPEVIACQNLGRKCRAVEISPAYVAVALQRFADHTGIEPKLIESSNTGSNRQ